MELNEEQFRKLVAKHPDLAKHFHFVRAGRDGRAGFWRRIPRTYYDWRARPPSQKRVQLEFAKTAMRVYDQNLKGLEDGLPIAASRVKKALKGKTFKKAKWEQAIEKLGESLIKIVGRAE